MKFAHLGDCHLGGWRQPELKELNFKSFQTALRMCIKEKVDFILIAGDLFDSAYPPIDTLKQTFEEFRKVKEAKIPVFLIAGSHDYSVSGKTFLDVLEKAGFCTNVALFEQHNNHLMLEPTVYKNVAIYGYPGKKSGLEVDELDGVTIQDSPGLFKILMLHTAIRDAIKGDPSMKVLDESLLPPVDYLALSHLHIRYHKKNRVYSGPIFPNNISELEELGGGSFYIIDNGKVQRHDIVLKDVLSLDIPVTNTMLATDAILASLNALQVKDKIVIIRVTGVVEQGKLADIDFVKIENQLKERGAFVFLKSTTKLLLGEPDVEIASLDAEDIESKIIKTFEQSHPSKFNGLIPDIMRVLSMDKLEDETNNTFEDRLLTESKRLFFV